MRTTSSVESFNAVLNRSIHKNPGFFRLILALRVHECRKADEMYYKVHNVADEYFEKKKIRDQNRDKKIKLLTDALDTGKLNTEGFMVEMAKEENCTFQNCTLYSRKC